MDELSYAVDQRSEVVDDFDEIFPGQAALINANLRRSFKGKSGRAELHILRDALLALPEKRLIKGVLQNKDGEVCAVGAYLLRKNKDQQDLTGVYHSLEAATDAGMPHYVADALLYWNDVTFAHRTPEGRYEAMLKRVEAVIEAGEETPETRL